MTTLIVILFVLVVIFISNNMDFIIYTINYYTKPWSSQKRLHHEDEFEMDNDPDDIVRWTKPLLDPIIEKPLPTLPDEIIIQILVRLPVRSLLQFRSVCSSWKTIISCPQFAKDHIQCSISDTTMTHQRLVTTTISNKSCSYCDFEFFPVQSVLEWTRDPVETITLRMMGTFDIFGSCNGLLCLYDIYDSYVRLWNPSTRLRSERSPILVNGPSDYYNITYCGFGYDHVHDKYKALIVVGRYGPPLTKVYTFGVNSWTIIEDFPSPPNYTNSYCPKKCLGTFVSGTLNWLCRRVPRIDQSVIVSFDLGEGTYGEVSLPENSGDNEGDNNYDSCYPELGVLRNCLCLCFENERSHRWIVWIMKKYGFENSWSRLLVIPHERSLHLSGRNPSLSPLYIWDNGFFLGKVIILDALVLYNSKDGRLKYPIISHGSENNALIYHESLVSPLHKNLESH